MDFGKMISDYVLKRDNLVCLFVLVDSRLKPQAIDLDFMRWLGVNGIPFAMVFTKADKLTANQRRSCIDAYSKEMLQEWEAMPPCFLTSSEKGIGRAELLDYIDSLNKME